MATTCTYFFVTEVNATSVSACMAQLHKWTNEFPATKEGALPNFAIIFSTGGGVVVDGLALYDFIRALSARGHHITTVALGQAASMGVPLLLAGDTRLIGQALSTHASSSFWWNR